jgi:hypothetical protein
MWLPTFLKRGIHFLGERTKVLGLNNSVFLDRFHLPIIGNRGGIVNSHESNAVTLSCTFTKSARVRTVAGFNLIREQLQFGRASSVSGSQMRADP